MKPYAHTLVVGGSGMLAGCSRRLLEISRRVTVLARKESRIRAIHPRIQPLVCDYTIEREFAHALARQDPPDLMVVWMHGKLPAHRRALAERLCPGGKYVQVLGSAHGDPSRPDRLDAIRPALGGLDLAYQAVVLEFVVEPRKSRWLTDTEISEGVFSAVMSAKPLCVVGTLRPWEARP